MRCTIRPGTPADATACARIIRAWGAETAWMVPIDDLEPVAAFWADLFVKYPVWVAERDGAVLGFCQREDDYIGGLYIAREDRGQGLGKRLVDHAKAGQARLVAWSYEANTEARRFYRREGFVEFAREVEQSSGLMNVGHVWIGPA